MQNIGASLIIERLSSDKMMKTIIKSKKSVLDKLKSYLDSMFSSVILKPSYTYKMYLNVPYFTFNKEIDFPIIFDSKGFTLSYRFVPEIYGVLFGVDLKDFDPKKNLSIPEKYMENFRNEVLWSIKGEYEHWDLYDYFLLDNDEDREKEVERLLNNKYIDINYIKKVYPTLNEFFKDFVTFDMKPVIKDGVVDRINTDYSVVYTPYSKPYGKAFLDMIYDYANKCMYDGVTSVKISSSFMEYLPSKSFLPCAIVLFEEYDNLLPSVSDILSDSSVLMVGMTNKILGLDSLKKLHSKNNARYIGVYDSKTNSIHNTSIVDISSILVFGRGLNCWVGARIW